MIFSRRKKDEPLKPPKKPEWSGVDTFIIFGVVALTILAFAGGVELKGGMAAGYATMFGAVFVLYQFPRFKKFFLKFKRWFDAALLVVTFFAVFSNFVFLVMTYAGLLFSATTAVLKYREDMKQYRNDQEVYKGYLKTLWE